MKKHFLLLLALALVSVFSANAKVIKITQASQADEFFALNGGDTLVLAEGVWDNLKIKLRSIDGTRAIPVVFKGETAGKTILRGLSSVSFSGYGVVVEDLWFEDPIAERANDAVVQFRTSDAVNAYESVLRNVRITGFNTDFQIDYQTQWVAVYGMRNTVEFCSFEDKVWLGCTFAIFPETGHSSQPNHTVRNNYFTRPRAFIRNGSKINSQESFRTSTYIYSMTDSRCLIENNVFEKCNGEMEYISVKSGNNTFKGNVFLECEGTVTLRHGNGNIVEGNYFDGRNVPGTGGIRIIGEDHIVRNNYMQNLAGEGDLVREDTPGFPAPAPRQAPGGAPAGAPSGAAPRDGGAGADLSGDGYYAAISTMMGVEETALNGYYQVKNNVIEGNVALDCTHGISIDIVNRAGQNQPLLNSRVSDNTFVSTKVAAEVNRTPAPENTTWQNNTFVGGEFLGKTASELGAVEATAVAQAQAMPVFEFGPKWKQLYQ